MEKMSKQTQNRLLGYSQSVADYVLDGMKPNEAIIKIACDNDIEPGHVRLLVNAYNNGKFNQQRKQANSLLEKLAHYELADTKTIMNELYPSNVKESEAKRALSTVLSDEYRKQPVPAKSNHFNGTIKSAHVLMEKASNHYDRESSYYLKKASALLQSVKIDKNEARTKLAGYEMMMDKTYDALRDYFKSAHDTSFSDARWNSSALFGDKAETLFANLEKDLPKFAKSNAMMCKCASAPVDIKHEPYSLVAKCIDVAEKHADVQAEYDSYIKEADAASKNLLSKLMSGPVYSKNIFKKSAKTVPVGRSNRLFKEADDDIVSGLGTGLNTLAGGGLIGGAVQTGAGIGKPDDKLKTDALMSVMDPSHKAKIRGIHAQATLHDLMHNDEFLSGEEPEKVTDLYNQITKLSPRAAEQPLLMKALLRRYLAQGQVDPHDVDQLAGIETKLKQRDEPSREMHMPVLPVNFAPKTGGGERSKLL